MHPTLKIGQTSGYKSDVDQSQTLCNEKFLASLQKSETSPCACGAREKPLRDMDLIYKTAAKNARKNLAWLKYCAN
jgi:hypothetical protein